MRAGTVCAAQQTLSAEAASVLKHSLSLARRRGHAQLTPLHVAATLLTSRASLLRRACLKSQPHQPSHPLQCRALELCFNVALNRLPATPGPLLHAQPSLSNALIAALKRAQAHQRRGCIEQQQHQQQSMIAVRVELEQLILSILDDPSVSRVMREAGFSSIAVKNNLEDSSSIVSSVFQGYDTSGGIYSVPNSPPKEILNYPFGFWNSNLQENKNPFVFSPQKKVLSNPISDCPSFKEDMKVIFEVLLRKKRRNTVVVADTLSLAEGLVSEFMGKVERGDVPEDLKLVNFIKFQFSSVPLKFMKREEVEMNVGDLKRKLDSFGDGRVIIYTGDLKWTCTSCDDNLSNGYSSVDHLISEIGKLISWYENTNTKVWLMGIANYQTYMKCQMKQPPLDLQWNLQAVSVPCGGLGLSLSGTSGHDSRNAFSQNSSPVLERKIESCVKEEHVLTCCTECKSNYEKEVGFKSSQNKSSENGSPQLPYWLQPQGTLEKDELIQLRKQYNKMCLSLHQGSHNPNKSNYLGNNYLHNSSWPNKNNINVDSDTISFAYPSVKPTQNASPFPRFRRQQSCHIEFSFSNGSSNHQSMEPSLDSLKTNDGKEVKITLALGNSIYNDQKIAVEDIVRENVPWQSETIPLILNSLMDNEPISRDKFVLIQGNDFVGKRRLAVGLAKAMFGSSEFLFRMNMRENTKTVIQNREILEKALRNQEKIVVLLEDVDYADFEFVEFLVDGFENGKLETLGRRDSGRAIFIFTTDEDSSYNKARDNVDSVIQIKLLVNESEFMSGMPNIDRKRKVDWDCPYRANNQRQVSSHVLDLNIEADEDEVKEGTIKQRNSNFLRKIKNCFVFNTNVDQNEKAKEMLLSKLKRSFQEVSGSKNITNFNVEEMVLDEIFEGSGSYLNSLFEQWLKDVFQTSIRGVVNHTGERGNKSIRGVVSSVRLCLEGKGENCAKDGFMGTCLPKRIHVSLIG
ncbi:hypothetical protein RD792_014336 [Penstemon davidsonii]|uniref:Clp R domain-containing protein n=1 Tax=Penstemon davidsonii TaxID=160366 RepID=A0ABR0CPL6_9LAMI|nr:hypothetical protein RD792_014336 [Penstemon davidsonii]